MLRAISGSRELLDRTIPLAHRVSDRRRRRAGRHSRHRLIGSLVVREARLPGADDHRHRLFPLSAENCCVIAFSAANRRPLRRKMLCHKPTDTPDKIDAEKLARVVKGVERVIRDAAKQAN